MTLGRLIYDYQTLITGVLAIGAAWWAARPAWKQISYMRLASEISSRETLRQRAIELEERKAKYDEQRRDFLAATRLEYDDDGQLFEPIRAGWAFDAEQMTLQFRAQQIGAKLSLLDTEPVDNARTALVAKLNPVAEALGAIHRPESVHPEEFEPEADLTPEEAAYLARQIDQEAADACGKIEILLRLARDESAGVSCAFQTALLEIRARIREIDELVSGGSKATEPRK
jgi:hypothetical protein